MKKIVLTIMILLITAAAVTSQDFFDPRFLAQLDLTAGEIEDIQDIQFQAERNIHEYNLEMNILKAQLEKLLLKEHPDMDQIRSTIEATLRWRSEIEITNVEARVQIREKMGPDNWEEMLKLQKRIRLRAQAETAEGNQGASSPGTGTSGAGQKNDSGSTNRRN